MNDDKKPNGAGKASPIQPPKPVLIGTEMEIIFQWGANEPIVFQTVKVTGDETKDLAVFALPTQYEGGVLRFVHPKDPKQKFEIKIFKAGTLAKEIERVKNKPTDKPGATFKQRIENLKKQN